MQIKTGPEHTFIRRTAFKVLFVALIGEKQLCNCVFGDDTFFREVLGTNGYELY